MSEGSSCGGHVVVLGLGICPAYSWHMMENRLRLLMGNLGKSKMLEASNCNYNNFSFNQHEVHRELHDFACWRHTPGVRILGTAKEVRGLMWRRNTLRQQVSTRTNNVINFVFVSPCFKA